MCSREPGFRRENTTSIGRIVQIFQERKSNDTKVSSLCKVQSEVYII